MANEQNLIPLNKRSKEEQRAIQSKGGKASGVSRGFRATFKKKLKDNPELVNEIANTVANMALDGDLKAIELLVELAGESARQQEINLKKQELKIKKQNAENSNW